MSITISGENNNDRITAQDGVIDTISGFNIAGIITASSFTGDLTGNVTGNLTGNVNSTSPLLLQTGGSERFRITGNNELGIAGANYGTAGQVLTSGGSGNAVTWSAIPTQVTINDNADNRVITGSGSANTLNGESEFTYTGGVLKVAATYPSFYLDDTNTTNNRFRIIHNNQLTQLDADPNNVYAGSFINITIDGSEKVRITENCDIIATSTSANATGPTIKLFHNSASPAANDIVSRISMVGDDAAGNETIYSRIETVIDDPTDGQEIAHMNFSPIGYSVTNTVFRIKRRGTGSAPSYTADDADGIILDVYNTGNPYPRYMNFIAKAAGNTASNIGFWTEAVGGSPTEKLRIESGGGLKFTGQGTSIPVGGILHHTNNNLYVRGGTNGLILGNQDNTNTIQIYNGYIKFETNNGSEKVRITSSGYVGVGINDPARILHLHEASSDTVQLHITNSTTGTSGSDGVSFALGSDESLIINQRESNHISLKTADTERLRIDSAGKLLLGDGSYNNNSNGFKMSIKESSNENAGIIFLDTDNMKGGICGIAKGTNQIITGTTNVDFVLGSVYADTHIIYGTPSNQVGAIGMTLKADTGHVIIEEGLGIGGVDPGGSTLKVNGSLNLSQGGNTSWQKVSIEGSGNTTGDAISINNWGDAEGDYWGLMVNQTMNQSGNYSKTNSGKRTSYITLDGRMGRVYLGGASTSGNPTEHFYTNWDGTVYMNAGFGSVAPFYGVRAWVQGNSGTTNASGGLSSMSRVSTGKFRLNFATTMPDDNYATGCLANNNYTDTSWHGNTETDRVDVHFYSNGVYRDPTEWSAWVIR